MFKKKKNNKKKHSSLEYYLCAGLVLSQVVLMVWDMIEYKKQEEKQEKIQVDLKQEKTRKKIEKSY